MGHIVVAKAFGMAKAAKVSLKIVLPEIKGRSQIEGRAPGWFSYIISMPSILGSTVRCILL